MGYIDENGALELLGGSKKLYGKLLNSFYKKYAGLKGTFEDILSTEDYDEARRLAHSIKGLSGNLGAYELQKVSMDLEYAYRDKTPDHIQKLGQFYRVFEEVIKEIKDMLTDYEDGVARPKVAKNEVVEKDVYEIKLKQLLIALSAFKYSEVKSQYVGLKILEVPETYKSEIERVFESIEHFDYQSAAKDLEGMIKRHNG